jgi:hypothetical protein
MLHPMRVDPFKQPGLLATSGLRLCVGLLVVAALSMCSDGGLNYQATLTVLNRTTAEVIVVSGNDYKFSVPACDEVTREKFPVNQWLVTSPGRDTFGSGGGVSASHSYLVVTSFVTQQNQRPDPLPPCVGLLQDAPQ